MQMHILPVIKRLTVHFAYGQQCARHVSIVYKVNE